MICSTINCTTDYKADRTHPLLTHFLYRFYFEAKPSENPLLFSLKSLLAILTLWWNKYGRKESLSVPSVVQLIVRLIVLCRPYCRTKRKMQVCFYWFQVYFSYKHFLSNKQHKELLLFIHNTIYIQRNNELVALIKWVNKHPIRNGMNQLINFSGKTTCLLTISLENKGLLVCALLLFYLRLFMQESARERKNSLPHDSRQGEVFFLKKKKLSPQLLLFIEFIFKSEEPPKNGTNC